jgi:hypothetical protein
MSRPPECHKRYPVVPLAAPTHLHHPKFATVRMQIFHFQNQKKKKLITINCSNITLYQKKRKKNSSQVKSTVPVLFDTKHTKELSPANSGIQERIWFPLLAQQRRYLHCT